MPTHGSPAPATDPGPVAGPFAPLFEDGRRQRLRPGAILFSEGDVSNRVVLVCSGRLKVSSFSEGGRETVLGVRGPGDLLGEFAAIDGQPHTATVTVVEPAEALILPADRFVAELEARPALALLLLRSVIVRLRDADRRRVEFTALSADGRVAHRLVELDDELLAGAPNAGVPDAGGRKAGGPTGALREPMDAPRERADHGPDLAISITQAELAGWVGCSREAVNKALGRFREEGLISVSRGRVIVLDPEGLRRRIGG